MQSPSASPNSVSPHFFDFRVNISEEVKSTSSILSVQVGLKVFVRNFISFLEPSVIRQPFLNSIISQMDVRLSVDQSILKGRSSDKPSLKPIPFQSSIHRSYEHEVSDVELPLLIEKRPFDVLLKNEGFWSTIKVPSSFLQYCLYLL